ncbi:MAG: hypothetical protein NVS9B14_14820 [Candidatus Acidiferrum sp.]
MLESRRRVLSSLGAMLGFAAAGEFGPSLLAQRPADQMPRHRGVQSPPAFGGGTAELDDSTTSHGTSPAERVVQFRSALRSDVEKLCAMASELKEEVVHINPHDTLSVTFIKKAQAIEKLAKQIKDHAIG